MFDFTCEACGHRFDKLFRAHVDTPKASCPKCGSAKTVRALSLVNAGGPSEKGGGGGEMPFCGKCGGPGPCGMN